MTPDRLAALYDLLDLLSSLRESNDLKVWSRVMEKAAVGLKAEAAAYYFYDTLARQLVLFHSVGGASVPGAARTVPLGKGLCGWTAKFREPLLTADLSREERYDKDVDAPPGVAPRSILTLPLFVNLDFAGVYQFFNPASGAFTPLDLRFAQTAAAQAAHALRRLRLEEMVGRVTSYNASILDNMSGGFLAVDLQGRVMICNPAARRILNIRGEVTDLPLEKVLAALPDLAEILRRTIASKQTVKRQELRFRLEDKTRLLGYSTLLIQDAQGGLSGAGITFQDLTQLKA